MNLFLTTFMTVFSAELGDKTQLAALAGAAGPSRARKLVVFLAASAALTATSLIAVGAGALIGRFLEDPRPIQFASGLLFVAFAVMTWRQRRSKDKEEAEVGPTPERGAIGLFGSVFLVVFLAELGDKTQLTTLGLAGPAGAERNFVFAGAVAALIASTGIAVILSDAVDRLLPPTRRAVVMAAIFLALGLWTIGKAFRD